MTICTFCKRVFQNGFLELLKIIWANFFSTDFHSTESHLGKSPIINKTGGKGWCKLFFMQARKGGSNNLVHVIKGIEHILYLMAVDY